MGSDALAATPRAGTKESVPAGKLLAWTALVTTLAAFAYVGRGTASGPPDDGILYQYSTALAAAVQYALVLAIVLAISRGLSRDTLGFRRPDAWARSLGLALAGLGGIWAAGVTLNVFLKAGEEQGLVPDGWDSARAGAFVANFVVIVIVAAIVEETTYRGLGFAAVGTAFGSLAAILVTGIAFGLSHGLVVALPVLSLFGVILASLRWRTGSLYPPMILHAVFNAVALIAAVTFLEGD